MIFNLSFQFHDQIRWLTLFFFNSESFAHLRGSPFLKEIGPPSPGGGSSQPAQIFQPAAFSSRLGYGGGTKVRPARRDASTIFKKFHWRQKQNGNYKLSGAEKEHEESAGRKISQNAEKENGKKIEEGWRIKGRWQFSYRIIVRNLKKQRLIGYI